MRRRPRVVQIVGTAGATGVESVVASLAEDLGASLHVVVVCLAVGPLEERLRTAGVEVVQALVRSKTAITALAPLGRVLRTLEADLVHTHGPRAMLFGNLAARRAGVRHVVTTLHECVSGRVRQGPFVPLDRAVERLVGHWTVDRWIGVSDAVVADAIARRGISPQRIARIYNGVDVGRFQPCHPDARVACRGAMGWGADEIVVAGAGRLVALKNYDVLLRAFAAAGPAVRGRLVLAGEGPERSRLEDLAKTLAIDARVTFLGSRDDLAEWLPAVDLFVQPSSNEALGLSALEAMACGCATVASRIGGLREIIEDARTGLLVAPADVGALAGALVHLSQDAALRSRLGAAGRAEVARRFSRAANTDQHLALYDALIAGGMPQVN
jgi:glycosyltransferase involved in cell wall biosynthesis